MIFRTRRATSLAAAALLASSAVAAFGAPAHAAGTETDLAVTAAGTRMTDGVEGKFAWIKVANQGEGTPSKLLVKVDVSKVDDNKMVLVPVTFGGCDITGDSKLELFTCELDKDEIPGPGETTEVLVFLVKMDADVTGPYTAPVTISIESADDTDDSNNSIDVDVELTPESGVDLGVVVPDVKTRFDLDTLEEKGPLRPGDTTLVGSLVMNQGNQTAKGLRLTYQLPKGATFLAIDGCEADDDGRTVVCEDKNYLLEPDRYLEFPLPITVDEDLEAPATLKGGSLAVTAFGALPVDAPAIHKGAAKPAFARAQVRKVEESDFADLDPSDNTDDFAVILPAPAGGGGGGGGLPVTGVQAGLIGGVGAAVVVAGAVLFLLSRRRRVVLVTPGDEKTNA
ncbi:hypothetical protein [Micromonospora maris]|uniref:LPXTG-motif cell wall anchor domain-containing protein n=2 Tax=Micromonospora TaxID=1873 RepID=A0A9X0LF23_9ACTN|nr:hypothetical protein [Micromonospora maris]AEB42341.1 cell wall anchor domain-containing protein [Micromonospora maris AB-18-032]KUJ47823.1 hypothetical protein ADL17_01575 [Micromonospora maris]